MPKTSFQRPPGAGATAPAPSPRPPNAQATAPAPRPRGAGAAPAPAPRPTATAPAAGGAAPAPAPRPAPRPAAASPAPVEETETPALEVETTPVVEETPAPAPTGRVRRTKAQIEADNAAAAPQSTAVVVRESAPLAEGSQGGSGLTPLGTITGEMDQSDLKLPQLKICSGDTSALARLEEPINQGVICVGTGDQWSQLWFPKDSQYDASEPIGVTVLRADKTFVQTHNDKGQSLYDLELQGMTFRTKEEMQEAGGTLAQVLGMLPCEPQLVVHGLVRMPEGFEDNLGMFGLETPDGLATQVMWYIRGSTYGDCAKKIFTERTGHLKNGSHTAEFNMTGKRIIGSKNSWWIPTITNGRIHTPEMIAFLQENA